MRSRLTDRRLLLDSLLGGVAVLLAFQAVVSSYGQVLLWIATRWYAVLDCLDFSALRRIRWIHINSTILCVLLLVRFGGGGWSWLAQRTGRRAATQLKERPSVEIADYEARKRRDEDWRSRASKRHPFW